MSYEEALVAAGAEILAFQQFGSYQGTWFALCKHNGKTGWVTGSYGSCSGCDAFESEFGYEDEDKPDYKDRLRDFGKGYLEPLLTQEQALNEASENIRWDDEAQHMVKFVKKEWAKL